MKKAVSYVAMGIALCTVTLLPSCSDDSEDAPKTVANVKKTGTMSLALQTTSASGKVYRLRQAVLPIESFGSVVDFASASKRAASLPGTFAAAKADGPALSVAAAGDPSGFDGGFGGAGGGPEAGGGPAETGGFFGGGGKASDGGFPGNTGGLFGNTGGIVGNTGGAPPNAGIVLRSEDDPTNPVLETFLNPGFYQIQLLDGWFIEQVDGLLGTSTFVQAELINGPFRFFNIESNQESFVQYQFLVNGERVGFGPPGRLIVGVGVIEQGGLCGNGQIDFNQGESCDSGDFAGQTCASATFGSRPFGFLSCTVDCQLDASFCFGGDGGAGGGPSAGGAPAIIDAGPPTNIGD
jgi:hypothetical protein